MLGRIFLGTAVLVSAAAQAPAQVVIRAPFVRVETGGPGTYVRAPFVNLFVPASPPIIYGPPRAITPGVPQAFPVEPGVAQLPPPRIVPQPLPPGPDQPPVDPDAGPPVPARPADAPTLQEFAKSFKPQAGNFEVSIANPINGRSEVVRFSLPGAPRQVRTSANAVEFVFGPRQFVRIEFDQDGPIVISR